jgi:hypothetical protein
MSGCGAQGTCSHPAVQNTRSPRAQIVPTVLRLEGDHRPAHPFGATSAGK